VPGREAGRGRFGLEASQGIRVDFPEYAARVRHQRALGSHGVLLDSLEPGRVIIVRQWSRSMARHPPVVRRGPFVSRLFRYPGKGGWTFAPIPKTLAPPVTRPWGRTPVRATVDGVAWDTSVWRDRTTDRTLLAVPARIRGRKGAGDTVTVEVAFDPEGEDV